MGPYDLKEVTVRGETLHIRPIEWSDERYDEATTVLRYESVCPLTGERIEVLPSDIGKDNGIVYTAIDVNSGERIHYSDRAEDVESLLDSLDAEIKEEGKPKKTSGVKVQLVEKQENMVEQKKGDPNNSPFQDPYEAGLIKQA